MEPAVGRREHAAAGRGHAAGHLVAAMEPACATAGARAGHSSANLGHHAAAMEPAVKRQEHPVNPALGMIFALAQRSSPSDGSSMQFAFEGLHWGFAGLDFATGEFPLQRVRIVVAPLADEKF